MVSGGGLPVVTHARRLWLVHENLTLSLIDENTKTLPSMASATTSAAAASGPTATSSGTGGMEGLLPLVLQLTNPEQVRETRKR